MNPIRGLVGWALVAALTLSACRSESTSNGVTSAGPAEIGPAECAACGMVVREQPAPRAQAIHRDGHRAYFCSIGDLMRYLESPSPHGRVLAVFVETLEPTVDPAVTDTTARRWVNAKSATYVAGISRPGVMGPPALVFESAVFARTVATKHGGQVIGWTSLHDALFGADAEAAAQPRTKPSHR